MEFPTNLTELYSGEDLATLFKGGFINFGYWPKETVSKNIITETDFVNANRSLYKQVLDRLNIISTDKVLEVGSGHGAGCKFAFENYHPQSITGLDYFQSHVNQSFTRIKDQQSFPISFIHGSAEAIPLPDQSIDKIYTIEAFQHFKADKSISEFARVLKSKGKLAISTFFAQEKSLFSEILKLIPRPALLSDLELQLDSALPEIISLLKSNGFIDITVEPIGEQVWSGYDKWVKQNEPGIWDTNWLVAYKKGLLDYYIICATLG